MVLSVRLSVLLLQASAFGLFETVEAARMKQIRQLLGQ
jgi:hypothetical protein